MQKAFAANAMEQKFWIPPGAFPLPLFFLVTRFGVLVSGGCLDVTALHGV